MDKQPSKAKQEWDKFCRQLAQQTLEEAEASNGNELEAIEKALQKAGLQSWKNCMAMTKRRQPDKGSA